MSKPKRRKQQIRRQQAREREAGRASEAASARQLPGWKQGLFAVVAIALFFVLLELALALVGVQTGLHREDPFVGFVSNVPLFIESSAADGREIMITAPNKRGFFNEQRFTRSKPAGVYRIFCVGGSTTYGRPYDDRTSFAGWLRELLPVADAHHEFEVINAGGISYASYRVARLMEELVRYEPDLFIVYTGHNEFLEQRTYGSLREVPGVITQAAAILARTRTWTAISGLIAPPQPTSLDGLDGRDGRFQLPENVDAILDHSAGPERYQRDDALREKILMHLRVSLERMVDIARGAGAELLCVTPASNLKDCAPFKSQHTDGMDAAAAERFRELMARARGLLEESRGAEALSVLDEALAIDPRYSEGHFLRGRALLAEGRLDEAKPAFERARDEDVCPLRALSPMQQLVTQVAREKNAALVDFVDVIEQRTRAETGQASAGQEYFLDHVHPTIEGNRLLAIALIEVLIERGVVEPAESWNEARISEVASRLEESLEPETHARALGNLALTLSWAGKIEESRRLAFQALESGAEDPTILAMVARHFAREGDLQQALLYLRRALRANPSSPVTHYQLGLLRAQRQELEAAAAHFFLASLLWPEDADSHFQLGMVMARRGRFGIALESLQQTRRLNPRRASIEELIRQVRQQLEGSTGAPGPARLSLTKYPSGAVRTAAQTRRGPGGEYVTDGIWTEWYENGDLEGFADYERGDMVGDPVVWDADGNRLSQAPAPRP
ncbi:MAG: tetratricopeptide repeat protein [Acidobacteriota bacterium]|nr:MAG: tetratricopeptide repeat protein [Acidobacteriota bacterium]